MLIILWPYSLIWKKVIKMVGNGIAFKLTAKPTLTFKLVKLQWLICASDVACQPLGHRKCDKATTSRQGKVPIFQPKARSFYTTEISYINFFP